MNSKPWINYDHDLVIYRPDICVYIDKKNIALQEEPYDTRN